MSDLMDWIDRLSWGEFGMALLIALVGVLGVLVFLDGLRNSRARYWGGQ